MGLAQNCQGYSQDASGKVTGVQLGITAIPGAKYEVYSVELIDEINAGGNTVAFCTVLDKNNVPTGEQVRLTWAGKAPPFADSGLAGNGRNEHVISNKYNPPSTGPLALHTGGFNAPTSDIVYGLGLPYGHHVSFRIVFKEKGASTGTNPGSSTVEKDVADLKVRVSRLESDNTRVKALQDWAKAVGKSPSIPDYPLSGVQNSAIESLERWKVAADAAMSTDTSGMYPRNPVTVGVHWIPVGVQSHKEYIRNLKPSVIKVVNGNRQDLQYCLDNMEPDGLLVVRDHARSEQQDFLARDPVGCGKQHALEWKNDFGSGGKYSGMLSNRIVVCGLNEPFVLDAAYEEKVLKYTTAFLNDLTSYGIRGLCMNLSVGWPRNNGPDTPPNWDVFRSLESVINNGNHILGLHEYWYEDPDEGWANMPNGTPFGWRAFRHRACPLRVPIIIGECGLTKAVDLERWNNEGRPPKGWIGNKTPSQYAEQLTRYSVKCSPNVIAVLPFTTGYASQDWAEDATDTAHADIVARRTRRNLPTGFPVKPDAAGEGSVSQSDKDLILIPKFTNDISGYYGSLYTTDKGVYYSHEGLDIRRTVGNKIYAAYDGVVAYAGVDQAYGNYIRTYSKDLGVCFFYGHLSAINVKSGQEIKQGDLIGLSGDTGNSSGPHIHFEIRAMNSDGSYKYNFSAKGNARQDPLSFITGWLAAGKKIKEV